MQCLISCRYLLFWFFPAVVCLFFLFLAAPIKTQESAFKMQNVSVKAVEVSKHQTAL